MFMFALTDKLSLSVTVPMPTLAVPAAHGGEDAGAAEEVGREARGRAVPSTGLIKAFLNRTELPIANLSDRQHTTPALDR